MLKIDKLKNCCGCSACASICSHNAISMEPDILGFKYPQIDTEKCVDCGLCERVCSFKSDYNISSNLDEPDAYGVRHKDINEVMLSRSGGAFCAIVEYVFKNGGVVYGAGYDENFRVYHKRATTKEESVGLRGSKYVQSDVSSTFEQVKLDLKSGLIVLFSGTACQVAGLKSYIGDRLQDKLILVDIVCHGVPSPKLWQDYLAYIKQKYKTNILKANFRDKSDIGWKGHKETFVLERTGKITMSSWTHLFYRNIMLRPSCGNCHFCNLKRPADITLGDFWGSEKQNPEANSDNKGLSLVLVNTPKGQKVFNEIKKDISYFSTTPDIYMQHNLHSPSVLSPESEKFKEDYSKYGFEYIVKKYSDSKFKKVIKMIKRKLHIK